MDKLTCAEYDLLLKAEKLKQVDMDYRCHMIAFLTKAASAEKSAGKGKSKPVYKSFKKFYDYDKAVKEAMNSEFTQSARFQKIKAYRKNMKQEV